MSEKVYDAIVIGGGVAGASSACYLAKRRYQTLLFEKEKGPHHKVCGEFLSPETSLFFQEMGLSLDQLGAEPISKIRAYSRHFQMETQLPQLCHGLSRYRLDEALIQRAEEAGAEIRRGAAVTEFHRDPSHPDRFEVMTQENRDYSRALFLAIGKHENQKWHRREGRERSAIGFKIHFKLSSKNQRKLRETIELFFFDQAYGGISPVEEGIANLCFIIDLKRFRKLGNRFHRVLRQLMSANKNFQERLKDAHPHMSKALAIANIPYGYLEDPSDPAEENSHLYYVGDQAAVVPSFTGTGIAFALLSAKLAAYDFAMLSQDQKSSYHQTIRQFIQPTMNFSYPLHRALQHPPLADLSLLFLKLFPSLLQVIFEKTRCLSNPSP